MSAENKMDNFFDQLPTPPKEKWMRGLWYAGTAIVAVTAVNVFMPYVNNALSLGLEGAVTAVKLGAVMAAGAIGVTAWYYTWPAYKRLMESLGRKATIWVFGQDPITPLHMWLNEVRTDCERIEQSAHELGGIIAENGKAISDNEALRVKADKRFRAALREFGEGSHEARTASTEAASYQTRIENYYRINAPMKELYELMVEIAKAMRVAEREAELNIETAEQEWRAALKAEKAMGAASRAMNNRSERYVNATIAFDIIRQKYAGSFGQLKSLRHMSDEIITKVRLGQAVNEEDALERLREQSRKLLAHQPETAGVQLPAGLLEGKAKTAVASKGGGDEKLSLFD